jgi:cytochrome c oxidase assembly protein subunit 15
MNRALKWYAVLTAIGMLVVVIMGAIVTKTGSADGCGSSWPLCYGEVVPDVSEKETKIEFSHRVVSGLLGIMVIILAVWSWKKLSHIRETKLLALLAVFFIAFQGLLGGAAVIWSQSSFILALHFGFSLIAFAAVLLLAILSFEDKPDVDRRVPNISKSFKIHIYALTIYTYVVVYSGALVRHTGSSLACKGWPLCNGEFIPPLATPEGIQFIHRALAGLIFLWLFYLFIVVVLRYSNEPAIYYSVIISFLLVTAQVVSGAFVVWTELALNITLLHGLFITLMFGTLCYLWMIVSRKKTGA